MLTERDDCARLRTFSTLRMLRDKTDFIANRELVEAAIRDAIAMEIDFVAVCTRIKPQSASGRRRAIRP